MECLYSLFYIFILDRNLAEFIVGAPGKSTMMLECRGRGRKSRKLAEFVGKLDSNGGNTHSTPPRGKLKGSGWGVSQPKK